MKTREEILDELVRWMDMLATYKKNGADNMYDYCEVRIHILRWVLGKERGSLT